MSRAQRAALIMAVVVTVLLGAALGLMTEYAPEKMPAFFAADPMRVWLVFGLLVTTAIIMALIGAWIAEPTSSDAAAPTFGGGKTSLRPPTLIAQIRGRRHEQRHLESWRARGLIVLAGAGGMGKTTLAAAAANAARRRGRKVHWIRFRNEDELAGCILEAAEQLGLSHARIVRAQKSGASLPDLVWGHLGRALGWMIVLDNVDRPAATSPSGDPVDEYRGWVRRPRWGLLLVTSRDRDSWGHPARILKLGSLEPEDAAQVLRDLAPRGGDKAAALRLANRLGGLPLALQVAASAVNAPTARLSTFGAYADALEARTVSLLRDAPDVEDPDVVRRLIGYTWDLSLEQLGTENRPLARPIMRLLAFCADAPIPRHLVAPLLLQGVVEGDVGHAAVDDALAGLDSYGLVDADVIDEVPVIVIHPVVRESMVALLPDEAEMTKCRQAVDTALVAATQDCARTGLSGSNLARVLARHLLKLAALQEPCLEGQAFTSACEALDRSSCLLMDARDYRSAIALRERLLAALEACRGPSHPSVLASRHNLAAALQSHGEHQQAVELYRLNMAVREHDLGPNDLQTLTSRNNLANALHDLHECREAVELHRANLTKLETVRGPDHRDTLNGRYNLANALHGLGEYDEAVELYRANLTKLESLRGLDNPDTINNRNNLANALHELREYEEAAELHRANLSVHESDQGSDDVKTLASRSNLAHALEALGDHQEATRLHRVNLFICNCVFGSKHLLTVRARKDLARTKAACARHRWIAWAHLRVGQWVNS